MPTSSTVRGSLTPRQNEIYEFIRHQLQTRHVSPTIAEIGERFEIRSTNGVNDLLLALERKGYIVRRRGTARGIQLPEGASAAPASSGGRRIPIVGQGESENPLSIFMNPQGTISPDPVLFPVSNSFAAIVADDAMDGEGIYKGDYVIVAQREAPPKGSLVFALAGSQHLVRRLAGSGGEQTLVASNRYYKPIHAPMGSTGVVLLGEVVGVMRVMGKVKSEE